MPWCSLESHTGMGAGDVEQVQGLGVQGLGFRVCLWSHTSSSCILDFEHPLERHRTLEIKPEPPIAVETQPWLLARSTAAEVAWPSSDGFFWHPQLRFKV